MAKLIKFDSIRLNVDGRLNGEWRDVARWPGVRVKVRALTSEAYTKAREAALETLAEAHGEAGVPKEIWIPTLAGLLVEHILLDWEGLADNAGAPLAFEPKFAAEFMGSPEGENMLDEVFAAARVCGTRKLEFVEALEKNFVAPSSGR